MALKEKITELTPEQERQKDLYYERYMGYGWSTDRSDRAQAEDGVLCLIAFLWEDLFYQGAHGLTLLRRQIPASGNLFSLPFE